MLIKDLREDFDFGRTDLVQIFIDSLHDRRSGFTFVVNPAGAKRDTQVSTNGGGQPGLGRRVGREGEHAATTSGSSSS